MMQTRLKVEVEYERMTQERPYLHTMPSKPSAAYAKFNEKQLSAIKETQRCPFPNIRQLIIMYVDKKTQILDIQNSDILHEKLVLNDDLLQLNNILLKSLNNCENQQKRLKHFQECTKQYLNRRGQLISKDVILESKKEENSRRQIEEKLDQIERQKQQNLKRLKFDDKNGKQSEETKANDKILRVLSSERVPFEEKAEAFLKKQQSFNIFKLYASEYEKGMIFIIRQNCIRNKLENIGNREDLGKFFLMEFQNCLQRLTTLIKEMAQCLFNWRNSVKHSSRPMDMSPKIKVLKKEQQKLMAFINEQLYQKIPSIITMIKADFADASSNSQSTHQKHQQFLKPYLDVKEVALFYDKEDVILQAIENELNSLTGHLRNNYGMIVPYNKSEEYLSYIDHFNRNGKEYLRSLINRKINFLEQAINYINNDYTCDGRDGVKRKVQSKMQFFQQESSTNQSQCAVHLIESCRKLLIVAKK